MHILTLHCCFVILYTFIYCSKDFMYTAIKQFQALMTSIRLSNEIKSRLVKIGARLSLKDGKARSMEDVIELLLDGYEKNC